MLAHAQQMHVDLAAAAASSSLTAQIASLRSVSLLTLTMLRKVVKHNSRSWTQFAATACCPFEAGTYSKAVTLRTQTVPGLQPMISLQANHREYSNVQTSYFACWQCGCNTDSSNIFFCPKCKAILPPDAAQADFFRVMGLPEPNYEVDLHQLEGEYKRLQKDLHPDKFGSRGAQQQAYSAEQSSLVNRAYTVLRNPLQRALYVLERRGMSIPDDGGTISDPQLLMEVMEQREVIEETDDPVVLQAMLQENKLLQQATTERLSSAFASNDLEHAERVITDLRYVTRTGEAISRKIPGG